MPETDAQTHTSELLVAIEEMLEYHDTVADIQTKGNWIAVIFNDGSTSIITVTNNDLTKE